MATPLDKLQAWAAKGLYVFPLAPGSKIPFKGTKGLSDASADAATIASWYEKYPEANWGVNCGMSGLLVVDVDLQKPGAQESYEALKPELPPTLTVRSPRGGLHLYFKGNGRNTQNTLGQGVDTRGEGGYVVLPYSTVEGKAYTIEGRNGLTALPEGLSARLVPQQPKAAADAPLVDLDSPSAVMRAADYLTTAPEAVEGAGGEGQTLRVAMHVKDLGISQETALALIAKHYSPRCSPPWDYNELAHKIANAYRYGKEAPGAKSPEAAGFQPVAIEKPVPTTIIAQTADTFDAALVPPRPWIMGHDYIAGFVTATVAPGGVGKSTISMLEAIAIAANRELTGVKIYRPGASWIYNTEDPLDELQRRVLAAAAHHHLSREELARVHVSSGRQAPLILAASTRGVVQINEAIVEAVIGYIKAHDISLWCVDPFVHTHYCEENSNAEIAVVMSAFGRIAEATGAAISLVHHTTKGSGGAGEMDRARGASSFGGAVRTMRTVTGMSEDEAPQFGIADKERKWYFWLDDAKNNMHPPADGRRAFRRVDVTLPNGDHVGTVEPVTLRKVTTEDLKEVQDAVCDRARVGQYRGHWSDLSEVVMDLKGADVNGVFKGQRLKTLEEKVREAFDGAPVHVPQTDLRIKMENRDGRWQLTAEAGAFEWLDDDEEN
jgi:hypothetical protein